MLFAVQNRPDTVRIPSRAVRIPPGAVNPLQTLSGELDTSLYVVCRSHDGIWTVSGRFRTVIRTTDSGCCFLKESINYSLPTPAAARLSTFTGLRKSIFIAYFGSGVTALSSVLSRCRDVTREGQTTVYADYCYDLASPSFTTPASS